MENNSFTVTFWGVRGSRPVPGPQTVIYGGNTSCVGLRIGLRLVILDAGTGIVSLGSRLAEEPGALSGDILVTHTHWDHIQGFPFFKPAYRAGNSFCLYGEKRKGTGFAAQIKQLMQPPYFPVPMERMGASLTFREILPGDAWDLGGGITVQTAANNHPGGGISYRVQYRDKSCCYVTDTEHSKRGEQDLIELCRGADLIIYDAHFTDEEYPCFKGWGHSTWQEGVKLAEEAAARQLLLFHHNPERNDRQMEELEKFIRSRYAKAGMAREGLVIEL